MEQSRGASGPHATAAPALVAESAALGRAAGISGIGLQPENLAHCVRPAGGTSHVAGRAEALLATCRYSLSNPVRKGLVSGPARSRGAIRDLVLLSASLAHVILQRGAR